jgi:hypothetical protein
MLAREVLRLRGTLATRETEWDTVVDLYFYRDPEAEENKEIADESKVAGAEEHPPDETDGVTTLVVGGDGNIDEVGGGVSVAKGTNYITRSFKEPRLIIVTDPRTDAQAIKEASYVNTHSVSRVARVPRRRRTSRASIHQTRPMA